jgi:hypothetical protein
MSQTTSSLLKLAIPLAGSIFILTKFGRREYLAESFRLPRLQGVVFWAAIAMAWMLGTDFLAGWRGPWDFEPWRQAPILSSVMRVLAVAVAGPVLEELVFRGMLFGLLLRTRLGAAGAILLTSLAWAPLHWDYSWQVIFIIFGEGLILGLARWRTGSLYVPIGLHIAWNLYAVW